MNQPESIIKVRDGRKGAIMKKMFTDNPIQATAEFLAIALTIIAVLLVR
jgi:hypothetical protein